MNSNTYISENIGGCKEPTIIKTITSVATDVTRAGRGTLQLIAFAKNSWGFDTHLSTVDRSIFYLCRRVSSCSKHTWKSLVLRGCLCRAYGYQHFSKPRWHHGPLSTLASGCLYIVMSARPSIVNRAWFVGDVIQAVFASVNRTSKQKLAARTSPFVSTDLNMSGLIKEQLQVYSPLQNDIEVDDRPENKLRMTLTAGGPWKVLSLAIWYFTRLRDQVWEATSLTIHSAL